FSVSRSCSGCRTWDDCVAQWRRYGPRRSVRDLSACLGRDRRTRVTLSKVLKDFMMATSNSFNARAELAPGVNYYRLDALKKAGVAPNLDRLPFSIKVVLESLLRNEDGYIVTANDVKSFANWNAKSPSQEE